MNAVYQTYFITLYFEKKIALKINLNYLACKSRIKLIRATAHELDFDSTKAVQCLKLQNIFLC